MTARGASAYRTSRAMLTPSFFAARFAASGSDLCVRMARMP